MLERSFEILIRLCAGKIFGPDWRPERIDRRTYRTRDDAEAEVFEYVERFSQSASPTLDLGILKSDRL